MTKTEILDFINAHPASHVATVEGNKPHVRGLQIHKADESGIIIQVWKIKDIHEQLQANPEMEICFNDYGAGVQVRVSGRAELLEDMGLKKQVVEERPFMKPMVESKGYDAVALYRLKGRATVWTRETNFEPKTYIDL
jgi:uncharacterized pyridoxamine 5'-phosphate oxidase family protein